MRVANGNSTAMTADSITRSMATRRRKSENLAGTTAASQPMTTRITRPPSSAYIAEILKMLKRNDLRNNLRNFLRNNLRNFLRNNLRKKKEIRRKSGQSRTRR